MKKNIRKITVHEKSYFYRILSSYCGHNNAIVSLKIYLDGHRQTPYILQFKCLDDFYGGASLYVGVALFNVQTGLKEYVTLHRPYVVRLCILKALEQGWDATKMHINTEGMQFLAELNLDITTITPKD